MFQLFFAGVQKSVNHSCLHMKHGQPNTHNGKEIKPGEHVWSYGCGNISGNEFIQAENM